MVKEGKRQFKKMMYPAGGQIHQHFYLQLFGFNRQLLCQRIDAPLLAHGVEQCVPKTGLQTIDGPQKF